MSFGSDWECLHVWNFRPFWLFTFARRALVETITLKFVQKVNFHWDWSEPFPPHKHTPPFPPYKHTVKGYKIEKTNLKFLLYFLGWKWKRKAKGWSFTKARKITGEWKTYKWKDKWLWRGKNASGPCAFFHFPLESKT